MLLNAALKDVRLSIRNGTIPLGERRYIGNTFNRPGAVKMGEETRPSVKSTATQWKNQIYDEAEAADMLPFSLHTWEALDFLLAWII